MSQKIIFSPKSSSLFPQSSGEFGNQSDSASDTTLEDSHVIYKDELSIVVGNTTHTSGSSAVVTRSITNYPWDLVYIPGNLIAVHCSGNYIAYALQAAQAKNGMVRIIHRYTESRGLVKNIPGIVKDLAFSHHKDQILLSFIDQYGTLFVYRIHDEPNSLRTELKLEVPSIEAQPNLDYKMEDYYRVIWCPFIPEDASQELNDDDGGDEENFAYLLVVTNGPLAEVWHVASVLQFKSGPLQRSEITSGYRKINEHTAPITDAAISPDGTALATASLDGFVKFFQVYMIEEDSNPRCIHQWRPHEGQPLSCLFFLDNHKNPNPDIPFWKFAITGANNNTELKIWSCETWHCHQTLKFESSPNLELNPISKLYFKAIIDPSAKFLVLSDINRRVLYILFFNHENTGQNAPLTNGTKSDSSQSSSSNLKLIQGARFVSITELPIQYSAIFLTITDASFKHYKKWKHDYSTADHRTYTDEHDDDHDEIVEGLVMKCMFINTKSFQEATIRFQPALPPQTLPYQPSPSDINISSSQDSIAALKDGLSDLSLSIEAESTPLSKGHLHKVEKSRSVTQSPDDSGAGESEGVHIACSAQSITGSTTTTVSSFMNSKPFNLITTPTSISLDAVASLPMSSVSSSLPSPPRPAHIRQLSSPLENASMTLLTPDSFSSPRRMDEDPPSQNETKEIKPKGVTPSPAELGEALSLWHGKSKVDLVPDQLACHEETLAPETTLHDVISGSSKSPILDPSPSPKPIQPPLDTKSDGLLATSEMVSSLESSSAACYNTTLDPMKSIGSPVVSSTLASSTSRGAPVGPASSTSSPSLEVQSILHSNEDENEDADSEGSTKVVEFATIENEAASVSASTTCLVDLPEPPKASLDESIVKGTLDLLYKSLHDKMVQEQNMTPPLSYSQSILTPTMSSNLSDIKMPLTTRSFSADASQTQFSSQQQSLQALVQLTPSSTTTVVSSSAVNGETNQSKQLTDILSELQYTSRSLPSGKGHITCEQLEASIKSYSPVRKSQSGGSLTSVASSSAGVPVSCPSCIHSPSASTRALQDPFASNGKAHIERLQAVDDKSQKIMDEISTFKEMMAAKNKELEAKNQILVDQNKSLSSQLEKTLKNLNKINSHVDELRKSHSKQTEAQYAQALVTAAKPAIESIVKHEIKQALQPSLNKYVETLRYQITSEIRSFSEQITKSIHTRNFSDNLSNAVANNMAIQMQGSFRDVVNKSLLPGFNSVSQQIFSQMTEAFSKGTKEYLQYLETECQNTKKSLTEQVLSSSRNFEAASTTLSSQGNSLISLVDNLNKVVAKHNSVSESLEDRLRQTLREEISRSMDSARSSRAQTPVPKTPHAPTNPKVQQQQIQQLISQGKINLAFKQALSASDLSIVVFVCERVNPQQLFSQTPCPLSQDVLLSLINQLSHDLATFTDLKTKYLEEALINLDKTHPVTMEHYQDVLLSFQRSLSTHINTHPNHKKLSLLLMAVNHMVGAFGSASISGSQA